MPGVFNTYDQFLAEAQGHIADPKAAYAQHKQFAEATGRGVMPFEQWLRDIQTDVSDKTNKEYLAYVDDAKSLFGLTAPQGYTLPTLKDPKAGQSPTADPIVSENLGQSKPQEGAPGGGGIPAGHVATPLPGYGGAQQTSGMIETMGPILNGQVPQMPASAQSPAPQRMPMARSGMTQTMQPTGAAPQAFGSFTDSRFQGDDGLRQLMQLLAGGGQ